MVLPYTLDTPARITQMSDFCRSLRSRWRKIESLSSIGLQEWLVAETLWTGIGCSAPWAWKHGFRPLLQNQGRFHGEGVIDTMDAESVILQENIQACIG